jgi:hypothetical protein
MVLCATCHREIKAGTQRFCNECGRGLGRPGIGTTPAPGRTAARRRRRRGR